MKESDQQLLQVIQHKAKRTTSRESMVAASLQGGSIGALGRSAQGRSEMKRGQSQQAMQEGREQVTGRGVYHLLARHQQTVLHSAIWKACFQVGGMRIQRTWQQVIGRVRQASWQ